MSEYTQKNRTALTIACLVAGAIAFLYAPVLVKLGRDWWSDENYSHGLLVPIVIAFIVWGQKEQILANVTRPWSGLAWVGIGVAILMLFAGVLGAELFTQRMSLVLMLAAITLYFFGRKVVGVVAVPFVLFLLAIPIPQILFNRIAIPLQMWASKMAVWGIRLFGIPTVRKGNVIDILPDGAVQAISLEVAGACSGIRSLMTLVTLALILTYFTRRRDGGGFANLDRWDVVRAILLMIAAFPVAVLTNSARVASTGILTFYYGKLAVAPAIHETSGWLVFVIALGLLISMNVLLKRVLPNGGDRIQDPDTRLPHQLSVSYAAAIPLLIALVAGGVAVNWLANREEAVTQRQVLSDLPSELGTWRQRGSEIKFSAAVEEVIRTSDYTMREYTAADGRVANIYVGYYATQRTGATYHSPQNCLPGAGWVLSDPQVVTVTTPQGRTFLANRYIIENGIYREVMLYWYQGRGRIEPSEYRDKLYTILDSVVRRRSDGAMVRVMTDVGQDEPAGLKAVEDLAANLEDQLPPFLPE